MCVLVVPDKLLKDKQFIENFEQYWKKQEKDKANLIESEKEQDRAFLEMVHNHQSKPVNK